MPGLAIANSPALGGGKPASFPLLDNLLAYWSLDETEGNRADSSGNGHTLTPAGSVTYDTGLQGKAAKFANASLDQLKIDPCPAALNVGGTESFAVWLWCKPFSLASGYEYRRLLDHSDATVVPPNSWRYRGISAILSNTGPDFAIFCSSGETNEPLLSRGSPWVHGPLFELNQWHSLLFQYDATTHYFRMFSDNVEVEADAALSLPVACPDGIYQADLAVPFILGALRLDTNNTYDGLIDEVAMWARVLTETERTFLHNSGSGRSYAELAAYTG